MIDFKQLYSTLEEISSITYPHEIFQVNPSTLDRCEAKEFKDENDMKTNHRKLIVIWAKIAFNKNSLKNCFKRKGWEHIKPERTSQIISAKKSNFIGKLMPGGEMLILPNYQWLI